MELLPLWIALGVVGAFLIFAVAPTLAIAIYLFRHHLVRKNKKMWTRECSWPDNAEQVEMFRRSMAWRDENLEHMKDVDIVNDGFHLFGEYYDFGCDKAVIIVPGRTEGCHYSLYFAAPYKASGYNVLAIDNRSHGLSDGKYNCLGLKEYRDLLAWGKMLHDVMGIKEIVLHGICIGSAGSLHALTSNNVPDYFTGIVADGMYTTFRESFKNHIIEEKHRTFPILGEVMLLIRLVCGVDVTHNGPIYCIDKLRVPILFIYTKQDLYSRPEDARLLYGKCNARKRLVWFDKGAHSHVRINDEEGYDRAVVEFLRDKATMSDGVVNE